MNLQNKIIEAKRLMGLVEGSEAFISNKGRVKMKKDFSKSEKVIAELKVKKGVVYVYEEGKQIEPKKEPATEDKPVSKLRGASNEASNKD